MGKNWKNQEKINILFSIDFVNTGFYNMNLPMCARCKKRPATVYIMKLENGEQKQEGLCLVCAKELGIKPVNDIMKKTKGGAKNGIENFR